MSHTEQAPPAAGPTSATDTVDDQHVDIRHILKALDDTSQLGDVLGILKELKTVLIPHFAQEESPGGLYDSVLSGAPRAAGQLDRLLAEHREMLVELEGLMVEVQACLAGPIADAIARARALQARLRDHEESEGSVLAEALYRDLGCGD